MDVLLSGLNRYQTSYYFFLDCSYYTNVRHTLFHSLNWLPNDCVLDLKLLIGGNPTFSNEQIEIILRT